MEKDFTLTASMMCEDFGNLEREIKSLEDAGIDSFHIDIMNGFVLGTTLLFGKKTPYKEIIKSVWNLDFEYLKKE